MKSFGDSVSVGLTCGGPSIYRKILRISAILAAGSLAACARIPATPHVVEVVEASIADLQSEILEGRTSCRMVVQAHLDRIEAYDRSSGLPAITVPMGFTYWESACRASDRGASLLGRAALRAGLGLRAGDAASSTPEWISPAQPLMKFEIFSPRLVAEVGERMVVPTGSEGDRA